LFFDLLSGIGLGVVSDLWKGRVLAVDAVAKIEGVFIFDDDALIG
jgi:hypothetical protein